MNSPLQLTARPAALQSVQTWRIFVTSSRAQWQPLGVGGHLLASPQPAWGTGAQKLSPCKSASALDTSEGTPQRFRHRPPLLSPDAVAKTLIIHEVEDPRVPPPPQSLLFAVSHMWDGAQMQ